MGRTCKSWNDGTTERVLGDVDGGQEDGEGSPAKGVLEPVGMLTICMDGAGSEWVFCDVLLRLNDAQSKKKITNMYRRPATS